MTMYEASSGVFDFSRFTPKYIVIAAKMNNLQYTVQYFNLKKKNTWVIQLTFSLNFWKSMSLNPNYLRIISTE